MSDNVDKVIAWKRAVALDYTRLGFHEWIEDRERDCDCPDRSWYGAVHDSDCAHAGEPNHNSLVRP